LASLNFEITRVWRYSTPWVESVRCPSLGEAITGLCGSDFALFTQVSDENSEVFGLLDVITASPGAEQCTVITLPACRRNNKKV
jgi:hypothetical protein